MKESFNSVARLFVQEKETKHLKMMAKRITALKKIMDRAEKKARGKREGGCGCAQCRKQYKSTIERYNKAITAYEEEFNRLYGDHPDHEEEEIKKLK